MASVTYTLPRLFRMSIRSSLRYTVQQTGYTRLSFGCTRWQAVIFRTRQYSTQQTSRFSNRAAHLTRSIVYQRIEVALCGKRWISGIGAEPGTANAHESPEGNGHVSHDSEIQVIDYSNKDVVQHDVTSATLESFLSENSRPPWAACRWIYVNGLNSKVVNILGRVKGLHRLTVEDVLDTTTPTKVDWYEDHCFMEMPLQKVFHYQRGHEHTPSEETLRETLRQPNRRILSRKLGISVEQVSLFLTADNTVITIFEHSGQDVLTPILTRLNSPQTMVRSTNDPWMLVQAVIDAVVDLSLPIGKAVGQVFSELEYDVLSSPAIAQSKELYVLRSGLTLLMENTNAIGGLVRTLCDHRDVSAQQSPQNIQISPITRVYLQDVQDHITTLSNSTKMSIRSAEHLTSLIFSTIAASQNESVRQLTLVSCFFLPLTFATGYFGMNFDPFPAVNNHSDGKTNGQKEYLDLIFLGSCNADYVRHIDDPRPQKYLGKILEAKTQTIRNPVKSVDFKAFVRSTYEAT